MTRIKILTQPRRNFLGERRFANGKHQYSKPKRNNEENNSMEYDIQSFSVIRH